MLRADCVDRAWVCEHGGNFAFLIAAHMTFSRVYDDFFHEPAEDSGQLVSTAGRRLLDAASGLADALPVPDETADRLLTEILERVRLMVDLATRGERSLDVVELKARTDADLVELADRLRDLG